MGYKVERVGRRLGLAGVLSLILGLVLFGGLGMSGTAHAAAISCGDCHSIPPVSSDNTCPKDTTKSHPAHASGPSDCVRCHESVPDQHPSATHNNNFVEITSVVAPGLSYAGGNCTLSCHHNRAAAWGGTLNCNSCHFRTGATANYQPSGLHVDANRLWKHYSSPIKVFDTETITCTHCHPDNESDTTTPRAHITPTNFADRGNMTGAHDNVSLNPGLGYTKGATPDLGTCTGSCHYNGGDPFGNYTIFFKPGQKKYFGLYQSRSWGDTDLHCNECHSTPSQSATFGDPTSIASQNANTRHEAHMFRYKLNPFNFMNEDRNIYCDDCHRTPDIFSERGFQHHSTVGAGGSGVISLPVRSQNARVYLKWRNNGIGRDGYTEPVWENATQTCNNIYCHTIMTSGMWTEDACDSCHGSNDGVDIGSGAPGYRNWTTASTYGAFEDYSGGGGAHYSHVMKRGYPCRTCHYDGGGDGNPANHMEGGRTVIRANVNVGVHPDYWFNNRTSYYDLTTRSCNNVKCHYGSSQNWDCDPLH
jgi:hypothetical protein